jgi:hypothetical protein
VTESDADAIARFVREAGIPIVEGPVAEATVLPGIAVRDGGLIVDRARLRYPGDLLHEAGHLAVMTPAARARASGSVPGSAGAEMAAIAWSYAACVKIGLDPRVVFHEHGYRGGSAALLAAFASGATIGVPLLRWIGLAGDDFPAMLRWTNATGNEP